MPKSKTTKKVASSKATFTCCPCVGATLDKLLQPVVLSILAEESMHGYELTKRISEMPGFHDQAPDMSGIYRLLKNLEMRGMVAAKWDVSEKSRAKRRYSITDDGRHCLAYWHHTLQNYSKVVNALLTLTGKSTRGKIQPKTCCGG